MKPTPTSDVFVSFATADVAVAETVVRALERLGFSCWFCRRVDQNLPGEEWAASISRALQDCQAVVLLHSAAAGASKYVQREISMAADLRKPIVTIRLDQAPLAVGTDYLLAGTQFLDGAGKSPSSWVPTLASRLSAYVINQKLFPLDSVLQRDMKVTASEIIIDFLFPGRPVQLVGTGLGLFATGPSPSGSQRDQTLALIRDELTRCVHLPPQADYGLYTIESKEDLYLLVGVAEAANKAELLRIKARLRQLADSLVARCAGSLEVRRQEAETEPLSVSGTRRLLLADFFTRLGKTTPAVTSASTPLKRRGAPVSQEAGTPLDPQLQVGLRQCLQHVLQDGFILPRLWRQEAERSYLRRLTGTEL